jgi:uncharacterized protein (DUF1330 family)
MSAYVIIEFTVTDPAARDKYSPAATATVRSFGGEPLANAGWETLFGDSALASGGILRFPDRQAALDWYNSPEYQGLVDDRIVAMDARFSLLDGLGSGR